MRIDTHQHVWTTPLLDALAERAAEPFIDRSDGLTLLHSAGEAPYVIDVDAEAPARRAACVATDGLDLALVAISSPIGIEVLPRGEARELIDAHLDGVLALPDCFAVWGPVGLDRPDPDDVDRVLALGCVGVSLPAGALAGPGRLNELLPVLARVAEHDVPLFVHPGRGVGQFATPSTLGEPLWWRAMTDYVAQMEAAWWTFAAFGRRELPELRVLFAMLAGGAPLMSERLSTRGGPTIDLKDPLVFYDTSSYGPAAVEMMARRVGEGQLVYGSDRPVVEPVPTGRERLLQMAAPALLGRGLADRVLSVTTSAGAAPLAGTANGLDERSLDR